MRSTHRLYINMDKAFSLAPIGPTGSQKFSHSGSRHVPKQEGPEALLVEINVNHNSLPLPLSTSSLVFMSGVSGGGSIGWIHRLWFVALPAVSNATPPCLGVRAVSPVTQTRPCPSIRIAVLSLILKLMWPLFRNCI